MKTKTLLFLLTLLLLSLFSCQDTIELEEVNNNPYIEVKGFYRYYHIRYNTIVSDTTVIGSHYVTNEYESLEVAKSKNLNRIRTKVKHNPYLSDKNFNPTGQSYVDKRYEIRYVDKDYKIN
jgi:hypothetical protein